jgi:hypothetical protein
MSRITFQDVLKKKRFMLSEKLAQQEQQLSAPTKKSRTMDTNSNEIDTNEVKDNENEIFQLQNASGDPSKSTAKKKKKKKNKQIVVTVSLIIWIQRQLGFYHRCIDIDLHSNTISLIGVHENFG